MKLRAIIFPVTLLFSLAICFSCECEQERIKRLLTDPNDPLAYKSWNLSVFYSGDDTLNFKTRHVILFQGNGVFEECNRKCWEHHRFEAHKEEFTHESDNTGGFLSNDYIMPPLQHNWYFGKPGTLILQGEIVVLEKITRDSLILRDYPEKGGRAVYLLKRDHSDIAFNAHKPHKGK